MKQRKLIEGDGDPQKIYADLPNHAVNEEAFLALVDEGLADIEAGRTVPFESVAAELRRIIYRKA